MKHLPFAIAAAVCCCMIPINKAPQEKSAEIAKPTPHDLPGIFNNQTELVGRFTLIGELETRCIGEKPVVSVGTFLDMKAPTGAAAFAAYFYWDLRASPTGEPVIATRLGSNDPPLPFKDHNNWLKFKSNYYYPLPARAETYCKLRYQLERSGQPELKL
ncbi:MAG: hypothetical protein WAO98_09325 [Alphaproteobacteria bacterium]